jgi:hypothetical protein
MPEKLTTRAFIEKARTVHGERYDYSKAEYLGCNEKIIIICSKHGEFLQKPHGHFLTGGCNKCGVEARSGEKVTTAELITRIQAVHGDKYDYSLVKSADKEGKLQLICPHHGTFSMWTRPLLKGSGCRKCAWQRERYLPRFEKAHGDKYTYDEVPKEFSSLEKISITCPQHGQFYQLPAMHARGHGCPACVERGFRKTDWVAKQRGRKAMLYVLFLCNESECFYKVGITYNGVSGRFGKYNMPYQFKTVATYKSYDAGQVYDLEKQLHRQLSEHQYLPKLAFGGQTECFSSILQIIDSLPPETFFLKNRLIK